MIKKFFSIVIISIMLFSLTGFVFAQNRELEIEYPEIKGEQPEETTTPVPEYFKYIFNFLIWISGLIALVVLVYAGFQYFTSAGNPEAMNDAKSRIGAALLGLLILFGSYLILITINPDLIVFHLPRLRPIISELSAGVLVCKEETEVSRAYQLTNNFKHAEEYWQQKMIAKELNTILDNISLKCYYVLSAGDIRADFDNEIRHIYFIPGEQTIDKEKYLALYGAILYEERSYGDDSDIYYTHFKKGEGMYYVEHKKLNMKGLSSIKPFVIIWSSAPDWKVTLYQEYKFNIDVGDAKEKNYSIGDSLYESYPNIVKDLGGVSPKSIKIEGDLLVVLIDEDPKTGDDKSEVFFAESDANLEDNLNIVEWVDCKEYESDVEKKCEKDEFSSFGGGYITFDCCAKAAATRMIIISAKPY